MKKVAILTALLLSFSTVAFAYSEGTNGKVTLGSGANSLAVGVSNGVLIDYDAATGGTGYAIGAYHKGGSRSFGSSSGDTAIFYDDDTAATLPSAPSGTGSADFSGWDGAI